MSDWPEEYAKKLEDLTKTMKSIKSRKKHKVEIPKGYEVASTTTYSYTDIDDNKICTSVELHLKPIKKQLPKRWDEYTLKERKALMKLGMKDEITFYEGPIKKQLPKTWEEYTNEGDWLETEPWEIMMPGKYIMSLLALLKLLQLRDHYNDGWEPDWTDYNNKYVLCHERDCIVNTHTIEESHVLAFKTPGLRDEFRFNFLELIETAKPLL